MTRIVTRNASYLLFTIFQINSVIFGRVVHEILTMQTDQTSGGSPAKSGQLDLATKNSFPLFFVSKKALVDIYEIYLF